MDRNLVISYEEQQKEQERQSEQNEQSKLLEQEKKRSASIFRKLAPASLAYALLYTFCVYKNPGGITIPVWVAASIAYAAYAVGLFGKRVKKSSMPAVWLMLLLGLSTFMTGNHIIIFLNNAVFFVLLVGFLLRNLTPEGRWEADVYPVRIVSAVCRAAAGIGKPFADGNAYRRVRAEGKEESGKGWYVLLGIAVAGPGILILGALLMTADLVFADFVRELIRGFKLPSRVFGVAAMILFGFFSSYCGVRKAAEEEVRAQERKREWEPVPAITVTFFISLLYVFFCGIQIFYLFLGNMQLPEGITYAEYARTGFFQLLFICILNLLLVSGVQKYFKKNRVLDVLLLVISVCTLIMTASSAWRMVLYIRAYHLTFLRMAVLFALAAAAFLTAGLMLSILRPAFPLTGYVFAVFGAVYLLFSFCHTDYWIASYNLARMEEAEDGIDYEYLSSLSTDAAPAVKEYLEELPYGVRNEYLRRTEQDRRNITPRNFNLSHYAAHRLLDARAGG